jgi:2,4-didehydro-3-deoxy-L-rhamnonate hydrolase
VLSSTASVMQDATTADMIFPVDELLAFVQEAITLSPGDLIATGTPEGVGAFRSPPVFLAEGDEITVEIEGIGRLTNRVNRR